MLSRNIGVELRRGTWADTDPLLMMRPPCGCLALHHAERVLRAKERAGQVSATTFDHCSKVNSSSGMLRVLIPALLNRRSMRPCVVLTVSNRAAMDAGWCASSAPRHPAAAMLRPARRLFEHRAAAPGKRH